MRFLKGVCGSTFAHWKQILGKSDSILMSEAIPQGLFFCLASKLQLYPQAINKKNNIKRKAQGPHHLEIRFFALFKV